MDNETMRQMMDQLRQNSECLHENTEVLRHLVAATTRQTDLALMQSRKLDFRDHRDNY